MSALFSHHAADAQRVLLTYGVPGDTLAEQRAYVEVLDRLGAFARPDRTVLTAGGLLHAAAPRRRRRGRRGRRGDG